MEWVNVMIWEVSEWLANWIITWNENNLLTNITRMRRRKKKQKQWTDDKRIHSLCTGAFIEMRNWKWIVYSIWISVGLLNSSWTVYYLWIDDYAQVLKVSYTYTRSIAWSLDDLDWMNALNNMYNCLKVNKCANSKQFIVLFVSFLISNEFHLNGVWGVGAKC